MVLACVIGHPHGAAPAGHLLIVFLSAMAPGSTTAKIITTWLAAWPTWFKGNDQRRNGGVNAMKPNVLSSLLEIFLSLFLLPVASHAQQGAAPNNYWGPHMMWGGGYMGGAYMIIFWIFVIAAIFLGIKWAAKSGDSNQGPGTVGNKDSSLEILKRRYAAGEIDRDEFLNMKKDLES